MRRILIMARQEFIKYVTRRGFLISIMIFPFWISLIVILPQMLERATPSRLFTLVDRDGGYDTAMARAVAQADASTALPALAEYAAAQADPKALRQHRPEIAAMFDRPGDAKQIAAFQQMGGWPVVLGKISQFLKQGAGGFSPPLAKYVYVPAPSDLVRADPAAFGPLVRDYLNGTRKLKVPAGFETPFAVVVVPHGFSPGTAAQYWSTNLTDTGLRNFVQQALQEELRWRALRRLVADPQTASTALNVSADMQSFDPTRAGGKEIGVGTLIATYVPMMLAFLLFLVTFMNASVLLQGVIEEKSSRMIEVLLSCATPHEIMTGKLIGVIAVSLTTILLWGLALFALMGLFSHAAVAIAFGGLKAIATVDLLPLLLLFFVCGLLIYSAIFLGIGSMTASLADAQALLGPVTLIILLPNLMVTALMRDPNGTVATVLSWIPIYTPFFMMFRLPSHPPPFEVFGTAVLAVCTATLLIVLMGRVFARNVLTTERPPSFGALLRRPVAWIVDAAKR